MNKNNFDVKKGLTTGKHIQPESGSAGSSPGIKQCDPGG